MREEKRVDYGSIHIHKKVLSDIVLSVVDEADGIILASENFISQAMRKITKKGTAGIFVSIDQDNEVSIEVRIVIHFGINIPDACRHLQEAIRDAIEKTTDISLKDIHINIQGIEGGA